MFFFWFRAIEIIKFLLVETIHILYFFIDNCNFFIELIDVSGEALLK